MKQYALFLALPLAFMACTSGKGIPEYQCFAHISGKDSILLQVHTEGRKADGQLTYQLYEKDQNDGSIAGSWNGDTLRVDYQFMSEGRESVREAAFLKKGDQLVEGFGNMEDRNGKMVFTSAPAFDHGIVYNTVDCQ